MKHSVSFLSPKSEVRSPKSKRKETKIERFEDIQAWQEAGNLTNLIYNVCIGLRTVDY